MSDVVCVAAVVFGVLFLPVIYEAIAYVLWSRKFKKMQRENPEGAMRMAVEELARK